MIPLRLEPFRAFMEARHYWSAQMYGEGFDGFRNMKKECGMAYGFVVDGIHVTREQAEAAKARHREFRAGDVVQQKVDIPKCYSVLSGVATAVLQSAWGWLRGCIVVVDGEGNVLGFPEADLVHVKALSVAGVVLTRRQSDQASAFFATPRFLPGTIVRPRGTTMRGYVVLDRTTEALLRQQYKFALADQTSIVTVALSNGAVHSFLPSDLEVAPAQ